MTYPSPMSPVYPYTRSPKIFKFARESYYACIKDRSFNNLSTTDRNITEYALLVFIMSAAALEALINELYYIYYFEQSDVSPDSFIDSSFINSFDKFSIRNKYLKLPSHIWGKTYNLLEQPYIDFDILIDIRNDCVHYQMGGPVKYSARKKKIHDYLRSKSLLSYNEEHDDYILAVPQFFNSKAALWAYNTSCQMVQQLRAFNNHEPYTNFETVLSEDNFPTIPID